MCANLWKDKIKRGISAQYLYYLTIKRGDVHVCFNVDEPWKHCARWEKSNKRPYTWLHLYKIFRIHTSEDRNYINSYLWMGGLGDNGEWLHMSMDIRFEAGQLVLTQAVRNSSVDWAKTEHWITYPYQGNCTRATTPKQKYHQSCSGATRFYKGLPAGWAVQQVLEALSISTDIPASPSQVEIKVYKHKLFALANGHPSFRYSCPFWSCKSLLAIKNCLPVTLCLSLVRVSIFWLHKTMNPAYTKEHPTSFWGPRKYSKIVMVAQIYLYVNILKTIVHCKWVNWITWIWYMNYIS